MPFGIVARDNVVPMGARRVAVADEEMRTGLDKGVAAGQPLAAVERVVPAVDSAEPDCQHS